MNKKHYFRWISIIYLISYLAAGAAAENYDDYLNKGTAYLRQGRYYLALDDLRSALASAATQEQKARAQGMLGVTHAWMRHPEEAEVLLRQATGVETANAQDRARWLAVLADLEADQGRREEAQRLYEAALKLVGNDLPLMAGIRLEQARLLPAEHRLDELQRIHAAVVAGIPESKERAPYLLSIGKLARELQPAGLKLAYTSLEQARSAAEGQPRLLAQALGGLAQLYEDQERGEEAAQYNQRAIQAAKQIDAHNLLLELEWRQGRLDRAQKSMPAALAAYQRAIEHIEAIRQDIPVEYLDGRSSFRETLEPVYLGLADLLLMQSSQASGEGKALLLRRAREAVEMIKQTELEDYLGGRCAVQSAKRGLLENIEATTAVLYPIILPDRLELLVSSGNEIQQFTQPVAAATLTTRVRKVAHDLRRGKEEVNAISRQLYRWLIAPAEPWLRQQRVRTLVFVPDGVLRLIPMAALHDGEHYLIEKYAIATSPGLTLLESSPLQQRGIKALLAGMSEPGPVIEHLPPAFLLAMAGIAKGPGADAGSAGKRGLPVDAGTAGGDALAQSQRADAERLVQDPAFRRQLKDDLSLPGVAEEIDNLRRQIPNTLLMNDRFTVEDFKRQAIQESYSVMHIASHGVLGRSADSSFIMAYDGIIDIDELEKLLKSDKFLKQPLELLTLSACQTAEGDDRAPLGLSGVAVKAKVRSALGTLWPVSDEAASKLMAEFYQALAQPGVSKVQALRQAQITLLQQKNMEHPFYWSPFILVGNWL